MHSRIVDPAHVQIASSQGIRPIPSMNQENPSSTWHPAGRDPDLSRRQWLKVMTATSVAFYGYRMGAFGESAPMTSPSTGASVTEDKIPPAIAERAEGFPLTDVRLLDGPFLRAQNLDEKYLLQLEPDSRSGTDPQRPGYMRLWI
jgi:hypothetical protein